MLQRKQNDVQQKLVDLKSQKKFMSRKDYEKQKSRLKNQLRDIIKEKWSSFIENNVENLKDKKSSIKSLLDSPNKYLDQYSESKDIIEKLKIDTKENKDLLKNVLQEIKHDLKQKIKRDEKLNNPPKSIFTQLLELLHLSNSHTR
ncbi:hypothetical protein [Wolbachia endosymbiont (group E) of Neria commutata]|uniref:hypothetical protein n=1 Tax=Wolbachia endosymbiont (group E) of Neria commutata TaxID=3066149 RepID=UPI00313317EB